MGHTRVFSLTFKNILAAIGFTGGECGSAAPLTVGHGHNMLYILYQCVQASNNRECRHVRDKPRPDEFLTKLYPEMGGNTFVDLAIDENGLWAIMAMKENNNTLVMKISASNMQLIWAWNITLNHNLVADMFIVCGVLYAVDRTDARETKIRLALDLYKHNMIEIELPFTNPFRHTTMLGYNPRKDPRDGSGRPGGFLYTWDGGNQLTYPVKYHDIGYRCKKIMNWME